MHESDPESANGWSAWVGDYAPQTCNTGMIATAATCTNNCSQIGMYCAGMGGSLAAREWSGRISEEWPNQFMCPEQAYVSGLACKGSWCDDVYVECTHTSLQKQNCYWSEWKGWSEFVAPPSYAIAGVECSGGYCSSMRFWTCRVN